jgi:endonuclease/exonuclease/phosphatase family metal-dependent hydrolase
MPVRIATFNCENLFSRAKLLNMDATEGEAKQSAEVSKVAQQIKQILAKPSYTAGDKTKIVQLIEKGKGFFTIEEDHGKLLQGKNVTANGAGDWHGHIKFAKAKVSTDATRNTGKVIKELKADILCTVEVENRETLGDFNSQVLGDKRFQSHMLIDGNDLRGIDVGVLSNLPLHNIRSHVDDKDGKTPVFSRDCIEYEFILPSGDPLWVLCNHFKSKGFGAPGTSDERRKKQAQRVAEILTNNFDLKKDLIVVAGDLNDTPNSDALSPLLSMANLHNIVDQLPVDDRFTHIFGDEKSQIDYLLVSTPLKEKLSSVDIERRGMFKFSGHFPSVTSEGTAASDHAAVVAEFAVA